MEFLEQIENSNKSILFKIKTIGPCSLDRFKEIKSETDDMGLVGHLTNWIRQNNKYIYKVIEVIKYYLVDKNTVITDNYLICIVRTPSIIKNRQNLSQFNITTSEAFTATNISTTRVFIMPPDEDPKKFYKKFNTIYDEYDRKLNYIKLDEFDETVSKTLKANRKKLNISNTAHSQLSKISDNIINKNSKSKFKIFKPNMAALKMLDRVTKRSTENPNTTGYMPPNARNKTAGDVNTIVIKNIPSDSDLTLREIKVELQHIFSKFGLIDRIKILTSRIDDEIQIKGIAFIDFYDSISVDKVMNDSLERKKIGHAILLVEKKL
jgi:hypothetical protein